MSLDDLQREILKVTKLGGMARVPEEMILESMDCDDPAQCRQWMEEWISELCADYHLTRDQDKDMLGLTEMLFSHQDPAHFDGAEAALPEPALAVF